MSTIYIVSPSFRHARRFVEEQAERRADELVEPVDKRTDLVAAKFKTGEMLVALPVIEAGKVFSS